MNQLQMLITWPEFSSRRRSVWVPVFEERDFGGVYGMEEGALV